MKRTNLSGSLQWRTRKIERLHRVLSPALGNPLRRGIALELVARRSAVSFRLAIGKCTACLDSSIDREITPVRETCRGLSSNHGSAAWQMKTSARLCLATGAPHAHLCLAPIFGPLAIERARRLLERPLHEASEPRHGECELVGARTVHAKYLAETNEQRPRAFFPTHLQQPFSALM